MLRALCLLSLLLTACHSTPDEQVSPEAPPKVQSLNKGSESVKRTSVPASLDQAAASVAPALRNLAVGVTGEDIESTHASFEGTSMTGAMVRVELESITPQTTYLVVRVSGKPFSSILGSGVLSEILSVVKRRTARLEK